MNRTDKIEIAEALALLDNLSAKSSDSGLSEDTCWELFGGPCPEALRKVKIKNDEDSKEEQKNKHAFLNSESRNNEDVDKPVEEKKSNGDQNKTDENLKNEHDDNDNTKTNHLNNEEQIDHSKIEKIDKNEHDDNDNTKTNHLNNEQFDHSKIEKIDKNEHDDNDNTKTNHLNNEEQIDHSKIEKIDNSEIITPLLHSATQEKESLTKFSSNLKRPSTNSILNNGNTNQNEIVSQQFVDAASQGSESHISKNSALNDGFLSKLHEDHSTQVINSPTFDKKSGNHSAVSEKSQQTYRLSNSITDNQSSVSTDDLISASESHSRKSESSEGYDDSEECRCICSDCVGNKTYQKTRTCQRCTCCSKQNEIKKLPDIFISYPNDKPLLKNKTVQTSKMLLEKHIRQIRANNKIRNYKSYYFSETEETPITENNWICPKPKIKYPKSFKSSNSAIICPSNTNETSTSPGCFELLKADLMQRGKVKEVVQKLEKSKKLNGRCQSSNPDHSVFYPVNKFRYNHTNYESNKSGRYHEACSGRYYKPRNFNCN
ncbi:GATA zinc finger domain-containing protein 14-like isoform X1 [Sitophilus oryzae]|uniref:GATA zinc finger domain-containing protein 14-like isoform X1 n=1 Tax=Sitophilus oryzae TaxID=7048 RepID=A0A6J2XVJ3_SITOR|nr:GATA zinc finger domain-containing protein 14-like isoform X1 [Sitophilus oryzae]XP_030754771.1 GATA zinc finger domain-containing protein 14-like isoform X1 [Sitophilus oryzae]